MKKIISIISQK